MFFALREKAIKSKSVFANVSVDEQSDFAVEFTESRKCGKRDGNKVADTTDVEDDLIRTFFEEAAAEKSNHRRKVLPPFLRLSTRGRGITH
jgi:hypothetical protein